MTSSDDLKRAAQDTKPVAIEAADFDVPGSKKAHSGSSNSTQSLQTSSAGRKGPVRGRTKTNKRWWHSQFNLMLAVFGLLAVAAALFVLFAPPPEVAQPDYASIETEQLIPDSQTPWTQSQQAEARSESQAILSNLLQSKKELENKGVLDWAPDRYQQALDKAVQGDELYKQANFAGAVNSYRAATDQMDGLYDLIPAIIKTAIEDGKLAIKEGKSELAKQSFNKVLELEEGNMQATEGLDRAEKLDQVLALLTESAAKESEFLETSRLESLESAKSSLKKAFDIDPKFQAINESLQRVEEAITEKRFQIEMSKAYQALFANQFGRARKAFSAALKVKPGDPTASAALQQSLASDKNASLASLLREAKALEDQEQWRSAQTNYETVLARDANQVSAKLGRIRSRARAQLNMQIEEVLSDTLNISRTEHKQNASKVLADARAIKNKGPKLTRQIEQIDRAITDSNSSIKVRLVSNALTQVSLQKIGSKALNLGLFSDRKMALKPGRYVATGVRMGFQDVRREIEIRPGEDLAEPIVVQCEQAISGSAVTGSTNG